MNVLQRACCALVVTVAATAALGLLDSRLAANEEERPVKVVFRFDDYAFETSARVRALFDAFASRRLKLSVAVIPVLALSDYSYPDSPLAHSRSVDNGRLLSDYVRLHGFQVAQHGYSHKTLETMNGMRSEFRGLPLLEQRQLLLKGRAVLESRLGLSVVQFVPPWNSYDTNTVEALSMAGFSVLSGDTRGPFVDCATLRYVPYTTSLAKTRRAVSNAKRFGLRSSLVVVLFHGYTFRDWNPPKNEDSTWRSFSFSELESLLDWVLQQDDVEVIGLQEAATLDVVAYETLSREFEFRSSSLYVLLKRFSPASSLFDLGYLSGGGEALESAQLAAGASLLSYLAIAFAGMVVSLYIRKEVDARWNLRIVLSPTAIVAAFITYGLFVAATFAWSPAFGWKVAIILFFMFGTVVGMVVSKSRLMNRLPRVRVMGP
jgi:peptidoglycan/xylan/chitin deacetylase (PgdA/CDA1 family)